MKEYEICIRGQAKAVLLEADSTISIDAVGSRTVVTGQFRNQESLLGYLGHLRDLGLEVLSTKEVPVRRRRSADPGAA